MTLPPFVKNPHAIPDEIKAQQAFLAYRVEDGRKIPYYPAGGKRSGVQGSPVDRNNLARFDDALTAAKRRAFDGIGMAALADGRYVGVDFDHCVDANGNIDPEVLACVAGTYAEVSPSGRGVRSLVLKTDELAALGNPKSAACEGQFGFELFSSKGYFTLTGNAIDGADLVGNTKKISQPNAKLLELCARRFAGRQPPQRVDGHADPINILANYAEPIGTTYAKREEVLNQLDPDMGYEDWTIVERGMNHETGGSDEGFEQFDDWSSRGGKYPGSEALRTRWNGLNSNDPRRRPETMRSVLAMLKRPELKLAVTSDQAAVPAEPTSEQSPRLSPSFAGFMAVAEALVNETAELPQPDLARIAVAVAMAAAVGGGVQWPDGLRCNLYGMCIVDTGGGKGHILKAAKRIAVAADVKLLGDFASAEGLEDELSSTQPLLAPQDEVAHVLAAREDKSAQHLKKIERALLALFSASGDEYQTRSLAGKPGKRIQNPYLNWLGFAVPHKLGAALTEGDATSGLLGRVLIGAGDPNAALRVGALAAFEIPQLLAETLANVRQLRLGCVLGLGPGANEAHERLRQQAHQDRQRFPEGSVERNLSVRTFEKAKRLAGVLAVFDWAAQSPEDRAAAGPLVRCEHLTWAADFVKSSEDVLLHFLRAHMHGGTVQSHAARLRKLAGDVLQRRIKWPEDKASEMAALVAGFVPTSLLLRNSGMNKRERDEAIEYLVAAGELRRGHHERETSVGKKSLIEVVYFPSDSSR